MGCWTFGDFVMDLGTRELGRGNRPVALSPKAFDLLAILITDAPRAVSKADLQERLWPDTFVVEKNVTNLVGEIRAALGDDPGQPAFVRTVSRFGYAFAGALAAAPRPAPSSAAEWPRHNLPGSLTSFLGRDEAIGELTALLTSTRLLTLTGAGGCGKTRLAIELARSLGIGFARGSGWRISRRCPNPPRLPRRWHGCSTSARRRTARLRPRSRRHSATSTRS